MTNCPCDSGQTYSNCCEPAHNGSIPSKTAEALMRSRYSAYAKKCIAYLGDTLHPKHRDDWSEKDSKSWADNSTWLSLEILSTDKGQETDNVGVVEFAATYKDGNQKMRHHEMSRFSKVDGQWYYVDGTMPKPETVRNASPKIGRNELCPCGSGKKYKRCCA